MRSCITGDPRIDQFRRMHTTKNKASKCVMARISRQGTSYQKNFTLRKYKTWTAAEKAAQKWVKTMLKELPAPTPRKGRMTKRNKSGIVGIWPRLSTHKRDGQEYQYCRWYARWPECPLKGGISFSAEMFGDEDAFAMAYLAVANETVDREWIKKKMKTFKSTKKYKEVLSKKLLSFE